MRSFHAFVLANRKGDTMNKAILITGGAGGIGEALCYESGKLGYNIILHYFKSEDKAMEIKKSLERDYKIKVELIKADLRNEKEVIALGQKANEIFGNVDVLINNAGMSYFSLFQSCDDNKVKELFDVNLMSAMRLTKEILPGMIRNHHGRIINISSMWGVSGASCEVHYSAGKSALIGFTKALAKEVGPSGITVNCIAPGFIDTKMNENIDEESVNEIVEATPMGRKGKGEDVAALAMFLCGDSAEFITGQTIGVDGGFNI